MLVPITEVCVNRLYSEPWAFAVRIKLSWGHTPKINVMSIHELTLPYLTSKTLHERSVSFTETTISISSSRFQEIDRAQLSAHDMRFSVQSLSYSFWRPRVWKHGRMPRDRIICTRCRKDVSRTLGKVWICKLTAHWSTHLKRLFLKCYFAQAIQIVGINWIQSSVAPNQFNELAWWPCWRRLFICSWRCILNQLHRAIHLCSFLFLAEKEHLHEIIIR